MFSILIASWNNKDYLEKTIQSLQANSCYQHEILVHVQEYSLDVCGMLDSYGVEYTWSDDNIGISRALNRLFPLSTQDFIVHMDDDMEVAENWDVALLEHFYNCPEKYAWISSTMIERTPGNTTIQADSLEEGLKAESRLVYNNQSNPVMFTREMWEEMGGADEDFFAPGFEEALSKRAWDIGCRYFVSIPESRVFHHQSVTMNRLPNLLQHRLDRDRIFKKKYGTTIGEFNYNCIRRGQPV